MSDNFYKLNSIKKFWFFSVFFKPKFLFFSYSQILHAYGLICATIFCSVLQASRRWGKGREFVAVVLSSITLFHHIPVPSLGYNRPLPREKNLGPNKILMTFFSYSPLFRRLAKRNFPSKMLMTFFGLLPIFWPTRQHFWAPDSFLPLESHIMLFTFSSTSQKCIIFRQNNIFGPPDTWIPPGREVRGR
jgi:hypothetical protein